MVRTRRQTFSDLSFIEHALNARVAMLTPRHRELLRDSRTLARLRAQLDESRTVEGPTEQRAAHRALLAALERRLGKLEHREGKVAMSFLDAPRMHAWSVQTQISSVC